MPITFESIQDPYGLRSASGALAQAMMQKNLLDRQEQSVIRQEGRANDRQIAAETRAQALKKQYGGILGPALANAQDVSLSLAERLGPLQNYISMTGDTSVLPLMKEISKEAQTNQLFQSLGLTPPSSMGGESTATMQPTGVKTADSSPMPQPDKQKAFAKWAAELTDEQLMALSLNPATKTVADTVIKIRDANQRQEAANNSQFQSERKYHAEGSKKAEDKAFSLRQSIPKKELSLNFAKDAILSGDLKRFSLANLAEKTGLKELQTAKGAQLITAGKEFLIGNLSNISAKAQNQWMEQRFASMFPEVGKSEEANLTIAEMLDADVQIDKAYLKNFDRLSNEDMEKYGYVRKDIDQRAEAASHEEQKEIMERAAYRTRVIYEQEQGVNKLAEKALNKVPKGTMLTPQMAKIFAHKYGNDFKKAIENAEKLGYEIPTREEVTKWQQ